MSEYRANLERRRDEARAAFKKMPVHVVALAGAYILPFMDLIDAECDLSLHTHEMVCDFIRLSLACKEDKFNLDRLDL